MAETRPDISLIKTGTELRRWYWLKEELVSEARRLGLKAGGAKFTVLDRLAHHRDTGEVRVEKAAKSASRFDWHSEDLSPETVITDSYKNTQNVRRFFRTYAGENFKFNIAFMAWMKSNVGKTLGDAVLVYLDGREGPSETKIKAHNQLNQYTRDFFADNPGASMADMRAVWAKKRALPSEDGRHRYERSDLDL